MMSNLVNFQAPDLIDGVDMIEAVEVEGGWYRYEDSYYNSEQSTIILRCLRVIRETPKGFWLDDWSVPRFVLKDARKRFAYPTVALARRSFLARKRMQVGILSARHDHAVAVLRRAEQHFGVKK